MDGFGVGYKLTAVGRWDAECLGYSVKRCLVDSDLADNVAIARDYNASCHRFPPMLLTSSPNGASELTPKVILADDVSMTSAFIPLVVHRVAGAATTPS
jgi:hypothetical protein